MAARTGDVPAATVGRLTRYLAALRKLRATGLETITSRQLGSVTGVSPDVVRSDLLYVKAHIGQRGVGYTVDSLVAQLREALGTDREQPVVLVGIGNLGRALANHAGLARQGFRIVGLFDSDQSKVGTTVGPLEVLPPVELPPVVIREDVRLAIVAVPARDTQAVAAHLAGCGIRGLLTFSPLSGLPPGVEVRTVDLAAELERLSFEVKARVERDR